ncbi:CybS-domain-containing protein [Xylariales sp. PMI_506]|nr:CybS-domain-containing protein [Xylariales sp. PMI_506]
MASLARPMLLRQTALATASRQGLPTFRSAILKDTTRVSAFHASSRKNLLPPGPQVIKGTVNDAAPVPPPSPSHGSYHWTFERLIAAGIIPLTVAPFAAGSLNPILDATLCSLLLVHSHMGFQNIIVDYIPIKRYPGARKFFMWALNAVTALVGIGLYEFETNDVGVTEAIKRIWKA